jgi:tRNA(His) 5'-end guanylyltransferase
MYTRPAFSDTTASSGEHLNAVDLGDRMKAIEAVETARRLDATLPIMVRLDGRSFSTFTRGMPRPFHEPMSRAMIETARYLVQATKPAFAYTQSDEISLGFEACVPPSQPIFDGRVQKLVSVLASMASAKFATEVMKRMPERADMLPAFDARAFNMSSREDMADCVLFRTLDCTRNAITMAALAHFSPKQIHGANSWRKLQMLGERGVRWNDFPAFFRLGTFLRRESEMRLLNAEELMAIPAEHRPDGPVLRSRVVEQDWPEFRFIENKVGVLFDAQMPVLPARDVATAEASKV